MNKEINIALPLADFLEFFLHIHQLNGILINNISNYSNKIDVIVKTEGILKKYKPETYSSTEEEIRSKHKEHLEAAHKEISEDFYSIKNSELIMLYSRFESAITEVIYLIFNSSSYNELPNIDNSKLNILDVLKMEKSEQKVFIADLYIQQKTTGVKYGYNRFEAILEPLIGKSNLKKETQDSIFRFAQIRNLLTHKNGVVDKQFKALLSNSKQYIGKRIIIDDEIMSLCISSIIEYSSEIIDRLNKLKAR